MTEPQVSLINFKVIVITSEVTTAQMLFSKNLPQGQESFRGFYVESCFEGIIVVESSWRREKEGEGY